MVQSDDLINRLEVGQKFYGVISLDQNQNYYVNFVRNLEAQQSEYIYGLVHFKNNKFLLQPDEAKKKFVEIIRTNNNIIINKGQLIKALQIKDGKKTIKAKALEVLGSIYSANDLNNYLAIRHNLPLEFSKEIEKEADNLSKINIYTKERKDLRELDFITIDPTDAMDHDDAISFV